MNRRSTRMTSAMTGVLFLATAAQAQHYDYGRSRGGGGGSGESGFVLSLEGLLANPRNVDNVVGVETNLSTVVPIIPVWDDDAAGRIGLGYQWSSGSKLFVEVWGFDTKQTASESGSLAFAIGPPIFTGVGDGYVGDTGNRLGAETKIEAGTLDAGWARAQEVSDDFEMEWSLGLRVATYEETHAALYEDGIYDFAAVKRIEGDMVGARAGARGRYRFGAFSVTAGIALALLDGEIESTSGLTPSPLAFVPSSGGVTDDSRSGSTRELDVALTWHLAGDRARIWVGWEQAEWNEIAADLARNFPGSATNLRDRDSVVFSGFKLGGRFVF